MTDGSSLRITDTLSIPLSELTFRASRSGGPGGQHVNTSSTRVELVWSVLDSASLTDEQRARLIEKLANRVTQAGELILAESGSRSQHRNREVVTERFQRLLAEAMVIPKVRRRTRPTRASQEERLERKRRRSEVKRLRGPGGVDE